MIREMPSSVETAFRMSGTPFDANRYWDQDIFDLLPSKPTYSQEESQRTLPTAVSREMEFVPTVKDRYGLCMNQFAGPHNPGGQVLPDIDQVMLIAHIEFERIVVIIQGLWCSMSSGTGRRGPKMVLDVRSHDFWTLVLVEWEP